MVTSDEPGESFAAFVVGSYAGLVRTAYLLTGDRGRAEDLAQESLIRTFRAWRRLRAPESAEAYARTAMVRLATRARRRRWTNEVPAADVPERLTPDVTQAVEAAEVVRTALQRLPPAQRVVLVLRYLEDMTEAQVAGVVGCSVGTVKSRASRGLAALRAANLPLDHDEVGEAPVDR